MNNLELLNYCVTNPEPYVEEAYAKECLIITDDASQPNVLMQANALLIERIGAYQAACEANNPAMQDWSIQEIIGLLDTPGINNGEFTNFWGVYDVSYSSFTNMTAEEKQEFITEILPRYITHRHGIYKAHGYNANALQVRSDSVAHKRSGQLGSRKVESVLISHGLRKLEAGATVSDFLAGDGVYILTDSDGKKLFIELLQSLGLWFRWSSGHQNKFPDFALRIGGRISIIEHKHMKEGGGGQDKQIAELIDFIKQNDPVSYVSFLDGVFFNKLTASGARGKNAEQLTQIEQALRANPYNYFLNTAGFQQRLMLAATRTP